MITERQIKVSELFKSATEAEATIPATYAEMLSNLVRTAAAITKNDEINEKLAVLDDEMQDVQDVVIPIEALILLIQHLTLKKYDGDELTFCRSRHNTRAVLGLLNDGNTVNVKYDDLLQPWNSYT